MDTPCQSNFEEELKAQWQLVSGGDDEFTFAVRSAATIEDLPDASFAGPQATYLNVKGYDDLKEKAHLVFASLFTDQAISARLDRGFEHEKLQLCATCQKMTHSETGSAGVMFSLQPASGRHDMVLVTSAYGLVEAVVGGAVNPDERHVFKPTLTEGKKSIISRTMGSKLHKMLYTASRRCKIIDSSCEERNSWSASDKEVTELAEMAMKIELQTEPSLRHLEHGGTVDAQLFMVADAAAGRQFQAFVQSRSLPSSSQSWRSFLFVSCACLYYVVPGMIDSGRMIDLHNMSLNVIYACPIFGILLLQFLHFPELFANFSTSLYVNQFLSSSLMLLSLFCNVFSDGSALFLIFAVTFP